MSAKKTLKDLNIYAFTSYLGASTADGWVGDYYECDRFEGKRFFSERACFLEVLQVEGVLSKNTAEACTDTILEQELLEKDIYVAFLEGGFDAS